MWDKLIFWGIGMYAVQSLAWHISVLYGFTDGIIPTLARLFVLIVLATLAGRSLNFTSPVDIVPYAAGWMLIAAILDAIVLMPAMNIAVYSDWNVWVGYALIFTIPLFAPHTKPAPELPEVT